MYVYSNTVESGRDHHQTCTAATPRCKPFSYLIDETMGSYDLAIPFFVLTLTYCPSSTSVDPYETVVLRPTRLSSVGYDIKIQIKQ